MRHTKEGVSLCAHNPTKIVFTKTGGTLAKNKHHPFKMDLKRETLELSLVNTADNHTPCEKI